MTAFRLRIPVPIGFTLRKHAHGVRQTAVGVVNFVKLTLKLNSLHLQEQESRRAYGTAVFGLNIHLNEIHLNNSQIWGASEHDPTSSLTLTNPYPCATYLVGGMLKITHPNPKSCSKCYYVPRSNFSFLGVKCLVGCMLKITHPNP